MSEIKMYYEIIFVRDEHEDDYYYATAWLTDAEYELVKAIVDQFGDLASIELKR